MSRLSFKKLPSSLSKKLGSQMQLAEDFEKEISTDFYYGIETNPLPKAINEFLNQKFESNREEQKRVYSQLNEEARSRL